MAKIRRIVRKVPTPHEQAFDERLWPVNVALLVLASFLVGMILAYRRFDDPDWYANAWTWLAGVVVFTGGLMIALRFVNNRALRRVVQLAAILSILAHVLFLIMALESTIFAKRGENVAAARQLVDKPPPVTVPEYAQHHFADPETRPKQDYEKPVETETPDSPAPEIARQETQPEPPQREPQPTPVPDPKPTREPNLVKKQQPAETSPRASEQASQLSRRSATPTIRPNQTADVPKPTASEAKPQPSVERPDTPTVARRETTAQPNRPAPTAEPSTPVERPTTTVARRTVEPTATPETSATPALPRAVAQPRVAPRTAVAAPDTPSVARQTTPDASRPATTVTTRQETATPQIARQQSDPSPQPPTPTTAPTPQRALPSPVEPTLASTPSPVANQRTRTTPRPQTATASPTADATPTPISGQPTQPTAQSTPIARTTTSAVRTPTPTTVAPATPATAAPSATAATRREATETPAPTPAPADAPSVARQVGRANPSPSAQPTAAPAVAAAQQSQSSDSLAPATLVTRRQATDSPQVARATGDPTPARSTNAAPSPSPSTTSANRTAAAADSPDPTPNATPTPPNPSRQTGPAVANVVTRAAPVAANMASQSSSELQPSASSSQVARQTSGSPAATRVQTPLDSPAASASNQVAQSSTPRTQVASQPSVDPSAPARNSPARTLQTAATAASPTNVESPAMSVATQGAGQPAAQPTPTALSKSQTGLTGAGASANLDRSSPAPTSPALAASGSAQRAEATQSTPEGAAFSPSMTAAIPRAVAGQARPSATLQAADVPVATAAGAAQPSELNASSSAALAQANSDASPGVVTADAGRIEVDLGPTRVVSESGSGRASGGGQPDVNFSPESRLIARSRDGGSPQMAIASTQAAAAPVAPAGDSGGSPAATPTDAVATATVRSQTGGAEPVTGGPSAAANPGPTTEVSAAPLVAESTVSRADAATGAPNAAAAAGQASSQSTEDEEEKARRLARSAAGGGPQLPVSGPVTVDAVAAAPQGGGGPMSELQASTFAAAMSRSGPSGMLGGPTGAPQTGPMAEAASGANTAELVAQTAVSRAEAVDAAAGEPALGGGAAAPGRTAAGPSFQADAQAQTVELAGSPQSGGSPQGAPLEAQGIEAARIGGGVRGTPVDGPAGAVEAQVAQDSPSVGLIGGAPGRRQTTSGASDAPEATAADSGGPIRRSDAVAAGATPGTAVNVADLPAEVQQALVDHLAAGAASGALKRDAGGGPLSVDIAAIEGPGGLGSQATADVGLMNRRASSESLDVQVRTARFQRQNVGGIPSISSAAIASTDPFRQRASRGSTQGSGNGSPPPQTEQSIELGLAFLARYQSPDGSWTLGGFQDEVALSSDTAATGLALLAFQGAGYNHREHKYQEIVRAGLDHLVKNQKDDGDLFVPMDDQSNRSVWLYSHSIAALALCEAYGMTQDPALKEPAQKAVDFIVASQQSQRGGWRYAPGVGADTSVSGWMMMALKSGELAGLKVPQDTYVGVQKWLDAAQVSVSQRHQYRYNPQAPDTDTQRHGRQATRTMTAVGLLMRMYLGWKRDNTDIARGADYLLEALPAYGTARNNERDTYYWYYATQVMFHVGGDRWEQWNSHLHPLLVQNQVKQGPFAGSWDPRTPVPDRWAFHAGRLYVTCLNLLSLEVYYRHLPLYDETGR